MKDKRADPFFIGWGKKLPKGYARFLALVVAVMIGMAAGAAFSIATTVNDPGDGHFEWGAGEQHFAGIITTRPYPVLHVPGREGGEPRAVMLSGEGKRGVQDISEPFDGKAVEATGILLKRGTIDMLQVGGAIGLLPADSADAASLDGFAPPAPISLGRYRLSGEICDGKCYQGAMRPGSGLAHKACANLCLIGGVPPVFVSSSAVEGSQYFLLSDPDGGPLPDAMYDLMALYIDVEGEIERRGDLFVFRADLSTARIR